MNRERICRWFHFRFCYWLGHHAPAGLIFTCVLIAYDRSLQENRAAGKGIHFDAGDMLNRAGHWAEDACKGKRP